MSKKIFVLGTGRSGTHLLGNILNSSEEIKVQFEKKPIFKWVTESALDNRKRDKLITFIILYYKFFGLLTKKHIADKSHPNLWLMEELYEKIPNSYFIGIIRGPHATVSSMLIHEGVLKWIKNWTSYPVPNNFLGITEENKNDYEKMSMEQKCTLRWIAHKKKLDDLHSNYSDRLLMIKYERLFEKLEKEISRIELFLDLENKIPLPKIKEASKDKWKNNLSIDQIESINDMLNKYQLGDYVKEMPTFKKQS